MKKHMLLNQCLLDNNNIAEVYYCEFDYSFLIV